ncbi:Cytochrome P450 4B1 [Dinochytrium kinnereticum]|nr:Cytochrome P450 4B1 [Dinochytrium kinnereticum]
MSSKDASPAPFVTVTRENLSRKPLSVPARLVENSKALGNFYVNFVMGVALVVSSDPDAANVILSDRFKCERKVYNAASPGILSQNGPTHAKAHRILARALSNPRAIKSLISAFQRRLKSETFPELEEAAASKGESIDLVPVFEELVADAVTLWITGVDEADKKAVETLVAARRTLANLTYIIPSGITWYFDRLRDTLPLAEYIAILPGTAAYHKRRIAKKNAAEQMRAAFLVAKERRDALVASGGTTLTASAKHEEPFINRILEASEVEDEPFSWDETIENLEAQIHLELQRLPRTSADPIRIDDIRTLPTLSQALQECLRILPPLPISYNRAATKNVYKLPGMWALPEGNHIVVDFLSLHRRIPSLGEDLDVFRPDRFKDIKGDVKGFLPFGDGPFGCPAKRIASDVIMVVVAEVLRRFEILPAGLPEGVRTAEELIAFGCSQGGALKHLGGAPVCVRRRKVGK